MDESPLPSFEEWVDYCFIHGSVDFSRMSPDGEAAADDRERDILRLSKAQTATWLIDILESPSLLQRFSNDQLGAGLWFLFGCGSNYVYEMLWGSRSNAERIRFVRAFNPLYMNLFEQRCVLIETNPENVSINTEALDGAAFMLWDMNGMYSVLSQYDEQVGLKVLHEPVMELIEMVLKECRTSACQTSALHAVGHALYDADYQGKPELAIRLREMIDTFTDRPQIAPWVIEYAEAARTGMIL